MKRLLAVSLVLAGCSDPEPPPTTMTDEEIALNMQCHDRHGRLAMAHNDGDEWVVCYQGRKVIWRVRL